MPTKAIVGTQIVLCQQHYCMVAYIIIHHFKCVRVYKSSEFQQQLDVTVHHFIWSRYVCIYVCMYANTFATVDAKILKSPFYPHHHYQLKSITKCTTMLISELPQKYINYDIK